MPVVRMDHHVDLQFNELRDAIIQPVAGLPTPLPERLGWIIFNTIDGRVYVCTGTGWELKATDSDKLNGQLPAYYLDRANQTGTQPVASISGFLAAVQAVPLSDFAAPTGDVDMGGHTIVNAGAAAADTDVPTWAQVRDFVNLQDFRAARVASTANITTATTGNGAVMDGVTLATGDLVLLRNQTNPVQNGLYRVAATSMARDVDANTAAEMPPGLIVVIQAGGQADDMFMNTTPPGYVMGTDPITFSPYGQAPTGLTAGNGIDITANVISAVAGTGIVVGPGGIAVDGTVYSRHYEVDLPAPGAGTSVTITHNLNRRPVPIAVMETSTGDMVIPGINFPDANTAVIDFAVAPTTGQYRVSVG